MQPQHIRPIKPFRLVSLDVMRGIIMILLAAESCRLYDSLSAFRLDGIGGMLVHQFYHHPWNGLHFWDLVQPAFMLMAGAAMYISYHVKSSRGITWKDNLGHIAFRCLKLFIFGVALHCVYAGKLVWELWNVLTQLAFTTMIAYLIIRKSYLFQMVFTVGLLLLTEALYRYTNIPGFDQPFVDQHNFGNWMDLVLMGKTNTDGWVAINIIPTAAHTIWGVLAGKLLMEKMADRNKIFILSGWAILCLLLGFALDGFHITPIIKRISTSSFTLASGGWVLLILAFLYWFNDMVNQKKYAWLFVVVGMNPIFIYIFFESVGAQWLNGVSRIFVGGFTGLAGASLLWQHLFAAVATLLFEWYICYWLFKRKIFFKL